MILNLLFGSNITEFCFNWSMKLKNIVLYNTFPLDYLAGSTMELK